MNLNVEIYNEDFLLGIAEKVKDNSVDLIFVDLPFGTTRCRWDTIIPFEDMWGEYNRVEREKPIYKGGNKQSEAIPIARTKKG